MSRRIALLGTHSPRQCGIASFTDDLASALAAAAPDAEVLVVAVGDGRTYSYPERVQLTVEQDDLAAYEAAADKLNALGADVLSVQHEFGIFGGPAGSYLLALLRRVRCPIVATLHTVLECFTPEQAAVMEELAALAAKVVVTGERAVRFLVEQGVPPGKIAIIHHGVPDVVGDRDAEKARLGLGGGPLILTFGLLSPAKGIETAIHALPEVARDFPNVTYLVQGATHPHVRARDGETYRDGLARLAAELGVSEHLRLEDGFLDLDGLARRLSAADICLIPYLNREQITSGTLAYAVGSGRAVVSTPFWHAEELLAEGRGALVPFRDPKALAATLRDLLGHPNQLAVMERSARAYGERMRWPNVANAYADLFDAARRMRHCPQSVLRLPASTLEHIVTLTDGTGVLQHAIIAVPNPSEGYTTDDNARALQLAALADGDPQAPLLARRSLSFLHHAYDASSGRFHNFMAYDRHWLDGDGGENTQARAMRALVAAAHGLDGALASTARELLDRSWPALEGLRSPRAEAIALIALAEHAEYEDISSAMARTDLAHMYADDLLRLHAEVASPPWRWFEPYLSYSNAKLPHGLIAYGRVFGRARALAVGLDTLRWLEEQQTAPDGAFLPVGCERLYHRGEPRPLWDGQPIEVYATVAAAMEAYRATGEAAWLTAARRALEWLLGRNALGIPLHDAETGGCRDGLHRGRPNANEGAESTLALWLSLAEYTGGVPLSAPLLALDNLPAVAAG